MRTVPRNAIAAVAFAAAALWGGWLWLRDELPFASFTDGDRVLATPRGDALRLAVWEPPRALGGGVNGGGRVSRPTVSPDGRFLVFAAGEAGLNAELYIADLAGDEPRDARPLAELNSPADDVAPAFAEDALYFASNRAGGAGGLDLYRAAYRDGAFGKAEPVGGGVNTDADETDPAPAPGGALAFASNRPREGRSDFDLYLATPGDGVTDVSPIDALNSRADDREPAFFAGGRGLAFASNRSGGAGGFDLYRTVRLADGWLPPRAFAGINSGADERGPCLTADGFTLWLAIDRGDRSELARARSLELFMLPARGAGWIDLAIFATLLLIALLVLLGKRWQKLDLLTKCLIVALLLHLLLLLWLRHVVPDLRALRMPSREGEVLFSVHLDRPAGGEARERGGVSDGGGADGSGAFVAGPVRLDVSTAGTPAPGSDARADVALAAPSLPEASPPPASDGGAAPGEALAAETSRVDAPRESLDRLASASASLTVAPHGLDAPGRAADSDGARAFAPSAAPPGPDAAPVQSEIALAPGPALPDAPVDPRARGAAGAAAGAARADVPVSLAGPAAEPRPSADSAGGVGTTGGNGSGGLALAPRAGLGNRASGAIGPQRNVEGSGSGGALTNTPGASADAPGARALPAPSAPAAESPAPARGHVSGPGAEGTGDGSAGGTIASPGVALHDADAHDGAALSGSGAAGNGGAGGNVGASSLAIAPRSGLASGSRDGGGPKRAEIGGASAGESSTGTPGTHALPLPIGPIADGGAPARERAAGPEISAGATGARADAPSVALHDSVPDERGGSPGGGGSVRGGTGTGAPAAPAAMSVEPRAAAGPLARADAPAPRRFAPDAAPTPSAPLEPERRAEPARVAARADHDGAPAGPRERAVAPLDDTPYRNRFGLEKERALEAGGGGAKTEAAVAAGLAYLARHQARDGSWPADSSESSKYGDVTVGRTGLSLLAFLGAGHTPASGTEHTANTARAVAWLLHAQDPSTGHFGDSEAYSHGIATYALAECFAITRDPKLRDPLARAVDEILHHQNRSRDPKRAGGWSYYYADDHTFDSWPRASITAWQVMALESARLGGVAVPDGAFDGARAYLRASYDETRGAFRYSHDPTRLRSSIPTLPGSTPASLFALSLLGDDLRDPFFGDALAFVRTRAPRGYRYSGESAFVERAEGNVYFWYYGSLALFRLGGEAWDAWNERLKAALLPSQSTDGSWRPLEPYARIAGDADDERSYTTAMCVLTLEVYYRYFTPLLKVK